MARLRRGSGHWLAQAVRISVQAGTQWRCSEELPCDPFAQGRGQLQLGVIA